MVLPGVQEIVGRRPTSSWCRLPRRSEFPLLTQWLRQSPFVKDGWGITYENKTREAQVLSAGSTMKDLPRNRGLRMGYKSFQTFMAT